LLAEGLRRRESGLGGLSERVELGIELGIVQIEEPGILPHEAAGEKAAGQLIQVLGLDGLQIPGVDSCAFGDLIDLQAPPEALLAEPFANRGHKTVWGTL